MSWLRIRREAARDVRRERTGEILRQETAWAAGTEQFQHRDPLYHVTESFHQTFDAVGRRRAAELAGGGQERERPDLPGERPPDELSARSFWEGRPGEREMLLRFSETAFQRGTLSGAILRGTGQMMLFSCLKKVVGQSQPDKWQQRKLFEGAASGRRAPGYPGGRVRFSRGFTYSAVGLVTDALGDVRRTVESLRALAMGAGGLEGSGAETLRTMYPFLDDSRERALLARYREQLEQPGDPEGHAALQSAVVRLEALKAKKAQMKEEWINQLRRISRRAAEAQAQFEMPEFSAALDAALRQASGADGPPEEDGEARPDGAEDRKSVV